MPTWEIRNQYSVFPASFFIKLSQKGGEMSEWIKVGLYCTGIHIVSLLGPARLG